MFEIPEDISGLSRDDLLDLQSQAVDRFNALQDDASADATTEMTRIADFLPAVADRVSEIDAAQSARDGAIARVNKLQQSQQEPAPPQESEQPASGEGSTNHDDTSGEQPIQGEEQREPVLASRRSVAEIAANTPARAAPAGAQPREWHRSLTAGAEINGVPAGGQFESGRAVVDALVRRTQALVASRSDQSAVVASARLGSLDEVITASHGANATTFKMLEAVDAYRNRVRERETLTAAGFCGPCETLFDFCEPEVADQLIDLPSIGIGRGCIEYFPGLDFSGLDDFLFEYCQPELEQGVEKPCPEIPCPESVKEEACVIGACAQADIISNHSFPEAIERQVRGILTRHEIRISMASLSRMEQGSTPVLYTEDMLTGRGFTATLLSAIEVQAEDIRADSYLGMGDTVRVVLDRWVRGAIRADLVNRNGVDLLSVTNERISQMFAAIGVQVTWVKNWQGNHIGQPGAQTRYPDTVKFLIYRDGAWMRGLDPVIELSTVYDSALLRRNKFTRLFTEQAFLVVNLCGDSRVVEVPVCPSGVVAAPAAAECFSETPDDGEGE